MPSQHLSVLMISTKLDPHVDAVLERLEGRGVPCFRLNTDHFHEEYRVTMTDEPTGTIRIDDKWGRSCLFPHGLRSVWMRKPEPSLPPPGVDDEGVINYVRDEMRELMGFLPMDARVPWINNPDENRRHQRKFPQLRLARSLGLRVPRSIITNDPEQAGEFFKTCPNGVICKPMLMGSHYVEGEHHVAYTRPVPPSEFAALRDSISLCPTYLQEAIAKDHELRVTIIGDELFCCRIDSQGVSGAEQDWRAVDTIKLPQPLLVAYRRGHRLSEHGSRQLGASFRRGALFRAARAGPRGPVLDRRALRRPRCGRAAGGGSDRGRNRPARGLACHGRHHGYR